MPKGIPERTTRHVGTMFLRVPAVDWSDVVTGAKRELRTIGNTALMSSRVHAPQLVVGYLVRRYDERRERLLIIEEAWQEPLGAISPDSLKAEGYASIGEFRTYWKSRVRAGWRPLSIVQVARLRPYTEADRQMIGEQLLQRVYGRWL